MGMPKRDLLKDVLSVFGENSPLCLPFWLNLSAARSKTLTKLAMDWQDTLKKASNGDN
jgi:protein HIRA/HIR1